MRFAIAASFALVGTVTLVCWGQDTLPPPAGQAPAAGQARPAAPAANAPGSPAEQAYRQQVSYALGLNFGGELRQSEVTVDLNSLMTGIADAMQGAQLKYTEEQLNQTMKRFQQEMQQKATVRMQTVAAENKRQGAAFLAENRDKQGIQVTPSGLQYRVLQKGDGPAPTAEDTVRCHYRGTLLDGTEFDSSYRRGEPAAFPVSGVIPGWTEALQMMRVGDKWQLFIPSELAYAERGAGDAIGPNETLIFEIELLAVGK